MFMHEISFVFQTTDTLVIRSENDTITQSEIEAYIEANSDSIVEMIKARLNNEGFITEQKVYQSTRLDAATSIKNKTFSNVQLISTEADPN